MAALIARRYAEAYFELASAEDAVDGRRRDLVRAAQTLAHPEVAEALRNPRLPLPQRTQLALDLLDGAPDHLRNLVRLLVERRRPHLLGEIAETYDRLADQAGGVVRVDVTTAIDLDEPLASRVSAALRRSFGKGAKIQFHQDPALIGGMIVRVGDRVVDNSLRTHLRQLQTALV